MAECPDRGLSVDSADHVACCDLPRVGSVRLTPSVHTVCEDLRPRAYLSEQAANLDLAWDP
jgi:hypothetical protein